MGFKQKFNFISSGRFLYNHNLAWALWFGLALVAVLHSIYFHNTTNYIIFKQVFWHSIHHQHLYIEYPQEYIDVNLYGPLFGVVMVPFAILPDTAGAILWVMFNTSILFIAIKQLPVSGKIKAAILILSAHEMMTAASWLQSNALIASTIIFAFVFTRKGHECWALFCILLGAFIKLYGIVGLSFFFFSRDKLSYIKWFIIWSVVFFILPAILSNFSFLIQSYHEWFQALIAKAYKNTRLDNHTEFQDISVMGMIRRIFKYPQLNDLLVLVPALILFAGQYLQFRYFKNLNYQLYLLCSVLLFTVIFSTSSESPTYIIAFPAICLWYLLQPKSKKLNAFFIFALLVTSFSYSDIFPHYIHTHIARPYSIMAFPCFITWLIIVYQIYTKQFLKIKPQIT